MEIKEQFQEFITFWPSGSFSKERLVRILKSILPAKTVQIAADQIFENFDKDGKDDIDFTEFIIGCHIFNTSTVEEKLHRVFQLFDSDQSGFIQLKEMVELFGTLYINEGLDQKLAIEQAYTTFAFLDTGSDGSVSEDEFIFGCVQDQNLLETLKIEF